LATEQIFDLISCKALKVHMVLACPIKSMALTPQIFLFPTSCPPFSQGLRMWRVAQQQTNPTCFWFRHQFMCFTSLAALHLM